MLSLSEIKKTLKEDNCNLGSLCKSNNINKWSLYKPVTINRIGGLLVTDLQSVDYGFTNLSSLKGSLLGIQNIADNGYQFEYSKVEPPYRISDFMRYNHQAKRWFDMTANINGLQPEDSNTISISWTNGNYIDVIKQCESAKEFDSFGFLLYYHNSAFKTRFFNVGDSADIELPYTDLDEGVTWNIRPCLANTNGTGVSNTFYNVDSNFSYLLLDSNILQFRYESEQFSSLWFQINWDQGGFANGVGKFRGAITFHNDSNSNLNFGLSVTNNSFDGNNEMFTDNITVEANNWYEILSGDLTNTTFNCLDSASLRVTITIGSKSADGVATVLDNTQIPKQFTFKYSNGGYAEQ